MNSEYPAVETNPESASTRTVRVWDLPTRLFHWALLTCVAGMFATAYAGGAWVEWHARLGYGVLTLLLFRLAWGFAGGYWSRFSSFLPRDDQGLRLGHSALGALSVIAMLLALTAQIATGLVSDDEIAFTGPLNRFVSTSIGLSATAWHRGPGQWLLVGLIALHIAAILFYLRVRRNNLIRPMIGGDKELPVQAGQATATPALASADTLRTRVLALAIVLACAGAVYALVSAGR